VGALCTLAPVLIAVWNRSSSTGSTNNRWSKNCRSTARTISTCVAANTTTKPLAHSLMLPNQTIEKLRTMRLDGMVTALEEQRRQNGITELDFEERLALLVERQWLWKENRSLAARLKNAQLKIANASLEDINYRHPCGLKRAQIEQLRASAWIKEHGDLILTGPTGIGKSYLACALGHQACRDGFRTQYFHARKLFRSLEAAHADGSLVRLLKNLARLDLFIIDDLGLAT